MLVTAMSKKFVVIKKKNRLALRFPRMSTYKFKLFCHSPLGSSTCSDFYLGAILVFRAMSFAKSINRLRIAQLKEVAMLRYARCDVCYVPACSFTYCKGHSSCKVPLLQISKAHIRVHRSPLLDPVTRQMIPFQPVCGADNSPLPTAQVYNAWGRSTNRVPLYGTSFQRCVCIPLPCSWKG
jgi:hypothetical protein